MDIWEVLYFFAFIVPYFMLASILWVLYDGRKHSYSYKFILGFALLWVITFPVYLLRRKNIIEHAKTNPTIHKRSSTIIVGLFTILFFLFFLAEHNENMKSLYEDPAESPKEFSSCDDFDDNMIEDLVQGIAKDYGALESKVEVFITNHSEVHTTTGEDAERLCKAELRFTATYADGDKYNDERMVYYRYFYEDSVERYVIE